MASSEGSELKSAIRKKFSDFDECESISLMIYSKYPLITVTSYQLFLFPKI